MNADEIKGKAKELAGAAQKKVGRVLGSAEQEADGTAREVAGKVQGGFGAAKRKVGEAVDKVLGDDDAAKKGS